MLWVRIELCLETAVEADSTTEKLGAETVKAKTEGLEGEGNYLAFRNESLNVSQISSIYFASTKALNDCKLWSWYWRQDRGTDTLRSQQAAPGRRLSWHFRGSISPCPLRQT